MFITLSIGNAQNTNTKKQGLSFGAIPVFAFDSDVGLKTGIAVNFYHFGDGKNYPKYEHSLFLKWYRTTKFNNLTQVIYDSEKLIKNVRITSEFSLINDKQLDFYGFNGYQSFYNRDYTDNDPDNDQYITKIYYKHARRLLRIKTDFQSRISGSNFKWLTGYSFNSFDIGSVDRDMINKKINNDIDMLPDTASLYDKYVDWGVIKESERSGGNIHYAKLGFVFDNRDRECNCNSGIWTEVIFLYSPSFSDISESFCRILLTHRQYFPLKHESLIFTYRLSYQTNIFGNQAFYTLPFFTDSRRTEDGLGGAKNLRGILRNRVSADGFMLANAELRFKIYETSLFNQNFYITLNGFSDLAYITKKYEFDISGVTESYGFSKDENIQHLNYGKKRIHATYGAGLYIVMNDNFAFSTDYCRSINKSNGIFGFYVGLDYIF